MSLCESQENVNIYFVIPQQCSSEEACSNDMKSAYTSCVEQSLHPEWITENSCLKLTPVKKDVFVFSEFEGLAYEQLCNNKCVRIVGPRCILTCLTEGISIPEGRSAIYTVGMRGLLISTTGFDGEPKKKITKLVEFMGGVFTNKLRQSVTHLVAHSVLSEKYQKATEQGIPVMTEKWVLEVWEASKLRNVHATDEEFMNYKCPIFHNLCVTSSGLSHKERDTVKDLVNSNGGEYSGKLIGDQTHMLVIQEPYGEKYKYASQWQLPCVLPAWIQDSIKTGYALPVEPYSVKQKQKSSTPVHDDPRLPNFSMISAVGFGTGTVDETAMNSSTFSVMSRRSSIGSLIPPKYMEVVNKLTLADAKKAGPFLDGCKVYLSGFSLDVCENLRKILNAGGATRFSVLSDPVSHIIVGDHVPEDVNYLKKSGIRPHVVTIDWLLESMKQRHPAPEDQFLVSANNGKQAEPPSPLSKKGAHLLRRLSDVSSPIPLQIENDKPVEKQDAEPEEPADVTIVHQYLNASQSEPLENYGKGSSSKHVPEVKQNGIDEDHKPNESSQSILSENTTQSSGCPAIFRGLAFSSAGFTEEETQTLEEMIKEKGGRLVHRGFKGIPDYGIVPLEGERLYHTTNAVVTPLWVEDCYDCGELVPVNYYHQPISLDSSTKPLKDCVIALSTYAGKEREFINSVAELLGARTQETFARVNNPEKGAIASTHLICPEPGSKKYLAALKWGVPAVNHRWLLACAREGRCVEAEPYLVTEPGSPKDVEGSHSNGRKCGVSNPSKISTSVVSPKQIPNVEECKAQPPALVVEETVPSVNVTRSSDSARKSMGPPVTPKVPTTNERERRRTTGPINSPSTPAEKPMGAIQNLGFSPFSQETPIRTLISSVTENANLTPNNGWTFDPNEATPKPPNYMPTPETPYGQIFKPNPSPTTRKNWKRWIDSIPEFEKLEPEEKKRRLSTPLSEIKRQIWEKFGGIKVPRKLKTEEVPAEEVRSPASPQAAARPLHYTPVAGTSRGSGNVQREGSPPVEKDMVQQEQNQPEATQNGPSAGINTQLHALGEILTVPVNSPRAPLFEVGEDTPNKVKSVDQGESRKTEHENLPASLEINTDCVDWVDPAVSDEASQEVKQPPRMMLSNVEDRDSYVKMIMDLGGQVSDKTVFDSTATHLICGKPARSEKLLGSIASGKWVLHKSFIDASCRAGTFVKEEEYEWGNPKAKELWSQLRPGSVDMALAKAVYRWRCKLCGSNRGAFSDMRAIIHTSQEKAASFARLIKAGGGQVLDIRPPYKNPQGATHCFAELNKLNEPIDMEALVKSKVPCLPPVYLNNYLVNDPPPDTDSSVLPEYTHIKQQLER